MLDADVLIEGSHIAMAGLNQRRRSHPNYQPFYFTREVIGEENYDV